MKIYNEEIFGPVLCVIRARNYDEALNLVNNHHLVMEQVFIPQMVKFPDTLQLTVKSEW